MKILLAIPSLDTGGAERMMSELANYWVSKGHQVSLVHMKPEGYQPFYDISPHVTMIPMAKGQLHHPTSPWGKIKTYLQSIPHIRQAVKHFKPDVIVSMLHMSMPMLMATMGMTGVRKIVSERTDHHHNKIPRILEIFRSFLYKGADIIHVQTTSSGAYFKGQLKQKIHIIPNHLKINGAVKTDYSKMSTILSVGRLIVSKKFDNLIRAFHRVHKEYQHLSLTIYGEGPLRSTLEKLINNLGLASHVFLPGRTKGIHDKLVHGDLFVFPSLYEGFPNALCEAMGAGLPVIASNCSGNIDIVQDHVNGRLFQVGDIKGCADIMIELIQDSTQRERLGRKAKELAKELEPTRIFAQWDEMIWGHKSKGDM